MKYSILSWMLMLLLLLPTFLAICNTTTSTAKFTRTEVKEVIYPFIIVYKNGTIVRESAAIGGKLTPPQPIPDPLTGVVSKDVILDPFNNITARMYIPFSALSNCLYKLPILVYYHGGGFCLGSAATINNHEFLNKVVSQSYVIAISINYRLFPDFALPTAYDDSWFGLQWVASQQTTGSDPWLLFHGNFSRVFLGGESSGANIVHNVAMRKARESLLPHRVHIRGGFMATPYFLGSTRVPHEAANFSTTSVYRVWKYVCPLETCSNGVDDPVINPLGPGAPSLARLATDRLVVYTAELDPLRGRGIWYADSLQKSGWRGNLLRFEAKNATHVFHIIDPQNPETPRLISRLAQFLQS